MIWIALKRLNNYLDFFGLPVDLQTITAINYQYQLHVHINNILRYLSNFGAVLNWLSTDQFLDSSDFTLLDKSDIWLIDLSYDVKINKTTWDFNLFNSVVDKWKWFDKRYHSLLNRLQIRLRYSYIWIFNRMIIYTFVTKTRLIIVLLLNTCKSNFWHKKKTNHKTCDGEFKMFRYLDFHQYQTIQKYPRCPTNISKYMINKHI